MPKRMNAAYMTSLATTAATYALIVLGGVVHNTGSSLACPDWPLCFGQVFPPMEGGVLYEHSHRLLGAAVGLGAIALCVLLWRPCPPFPSLRGPAAALLGLIVFQGVLGGITVLYRLPPLVSTAHLGTSLVVLMLELYLVAQTRRRARAPIAGAEPPIPDARPAVNLLAIAVIAVYLQMVLGALIRHTGATYALQLGWAGALVGVDPASWQPVLWPADPPAQANVLHRYLAVPIALLVVLASAQAHVAAKAAGRQRLARWAWGPVGWVVLQIAIGVVMLGTMLHVVARTAHLGVAAALLAHLFALLTVFVEDGARAPQPARAAAGPPPVRSEA